jgi:hypothetical protein
MAKKVSKKKTTPKKKSCTKKDVDKCPKQNCTKKQTPISTPEFEVKPLTKQDYFFGLIKRAFGYE